MTNGRYFLAVLFVLSTLSSSCGLVAPSHHRTEEYTQVFSDATGGNLKAVQQAVEKDPNLVKATEWENATLLHDAVIQNHIDIAKYLLEKEADVNAVKTDGVTALHMAARNGNIEMMMLLLQWGATINAVDAKGWTPLDRAQKWGHQDAAEFLRHHEGHEGR
jgi:ankyrin repeat protein